ncbi:PD-(D/E)XK nuclease family protein [Maribacter polysiphoniae]|uniref:PD-(D/E)XK nuclease family protein n=1 Tax=Maribacter polysiphoniae TaxID=429344 RepID=A0A316EA59_9FLAO|nr:PD-(D/E)XK nuclease family protein [Maribacter polysiphoniae]MBD1260174.1 PD-(D/E)XK nuclease family protein [Maribacter polysiphoniae]PWK25633.1 PD-(D/E)XK nuclease superfamily protein [Maribacter polysiphoniae]
MQSFLEQVLSTIYKDQGSFENTIFVLPSKRAGSYLKKGIAKITQNPIFAPIIYSIEEFVSEISGLSTATNTQQLFELYYAYLEQPEKDQDSFLDFSKWGQTLLQDFNEIDRYLIDEKSLFSNLSAIQEINHWYLAAEKTKMVQDYVNFWNTLDQLYHSFNKRLLKKDIGHQGLVYRKANEKLKDYILAQKHKRHVFIGFNALNTAESTIIQSILQTGNADIFWDLDSYFLKDQIHDAGYFIRNHKKTWPYLEQHALKGISSSFIQDKRIEIIGVPKNISQTKYIGSLLKQMALNTNGKLSSTAVVLNDESLLNPLLNSIPKEIEKVNITMGFPLDKTSFKNFFNQFFDLYVHKQPHGWYYKNILSFLSDPYTHLLLNDDHIALSEVLVQEITTHNLSFLTRHQLLSLIKIDHPFLGTLFYEPIPSPIEFIRHCLEITAILKTKLQNNNNSLALEELYRFYGIFNQIAMILEEHEFINDLKSLQTLFQELVSMETLDFKGDPIEGLQIMGMLESRNLDFETVILSSVNEGILPAGKSNNSFIPFDLKRNFGLPTFKEKDAVYTYHFYRLLQRAKHIYLIYNTEPDVLEGGERSRLITQLLTDENIKNNITEYVAIPDIKVEPEKEIRIQKDQALLQLIQGHALKGFSPSSLSNYIRNPLDFYKQNLLKINDLPEVEETVAANTFGTIIHDTLEDLYTPLIGKFLNKELLTKMKGQIEGLVQHHFAKSYAAIEVLRGKNLIAYNVILKYIQSFIDYEIRESENHAIKILGLEQKMEIALSFTEVGFPVHLKGKLDRIDEIDGRLRIIDYKSGKVLANQVEIFDWTILTEDYKYSKAFQLLCYALMYTEGKKDYEIEAGIISFKNLSAGLLNFAVKSSKNSRSGKNIAITPDTLSDFTKELKRLVLEICNPNIPFIEKEV